MRRQRLVGVAVGLGDATTALGLLVDPEATIRLMGIAAEATAGVWLRFIGAFVLGVGIATLEPALRRATNRLAGALAATLTIRLLVASTVVTLVMFGELAAGWLLVSLWDATAAALQLWSLMEKADES